MRRVGGEWRFDTARGCKTETFIRMVTKTLIERLMPGARRCHFKALCIVALLVMGASVVTALWAAANDRGAAFAISLGFCLAAMYVARDCDEAAGNIFSE